MFEILTSVILAVASIALQAKPYTNFTYIAEAKTNSLASSVLTVEKIPETTETKPVLKIAYTDKEIFPEILNRIAFCESNGKQFDENGQVVRGKENPNDIGKYQINLLFHLETSQKMGLDIFTEEGNEKYALYLYKKNGAKDWLASKECWKNI